MNVSRDFPLCDIPFMSVFLKIFSPISAEVGGYSGMKSSSDLCVKCAQFAFLNLCNRKDWWILEGLGLSESRTVFKWSKRGLINTLEADVY